jgi:hypothetical protein
MRKKEFIHLHGLFAEVKKFVEEQENKTVHTEEYDQTNTRPTSIHKSKSDQKEATFLLLNELTDEMEIPNENKVNTTEAR